MREGEESRIKSKINQTSDGTVNGAVFCWLADSVLCGLSVKGAVLRTGVGFRVTCP